MSFFLFFCDLKKLINELPIPIPCKNSWRKSKKPIFFWWIPKNLVTMHFQKRATVINLFPMAKLRCEIFWHPKVNFSVYKKGIIFFEKPILLCPSSKRKIGSNLRFILVIISMIFWPVSICTLFRNKRFMLDEMTWRNASKFCHILYMKYGNFIKHKPLISEECT